MTSQRRTGIVVHGYGWMTGVGAAQRMLIRGIGSVAPDLPVTFYGNRTDLDLIPPNPCWDRIEVSDLDELQAAVTARPPALLHVPMCLPMNRMPCLTVVSVHDTMMLRNVDQRPGPIAELDAISVRRAVAAADHVLTVSEFSKACIVRDLAVAPAGISVVHNGIDAEFRRTAGAGDSANPYIINVGGRQHRKNLSLAVAATSIFRSRDHWNVRLVIVNGRDDQDGIHADVDAEIERGLGIAGLTRPERPAWIEVLGEVSTPALSALYGRATALIYPSAEEGFGLPPLEAMASGTAVVTSTGGALAEICGDAAMYGRTGDPASFADRLSSIVHDRAVRESLVAAGLRRAARFTEKRMATETLSAYASLLTDDA